MDSKDSLLIRIARKPLLVAVLFLLTALLPWALTMLGPLAVKAIQPGVLMDLARWLSAPLLFAIVNFAIFFLWMNSSSPPRRRASIIPAAEDEEESLLKTDYAPPSHFPSSDEPLVQARNVDGPSTASAAMRPPKDAASTPASTGEDAMPRKGHKKSRSLTIDPSTLQLATEIPQGPSTTRTPARRNSSPRAKTPGAGRRSKSEQNKFDSKVIASLDNSSSSSHVARRNSSPRPADEQQQQQQQQQQDHHAHASIKPSQSSNSYVYTPPVRDPIPLEKDDLNARIDSFLTKFKMQRQESNLRALTSQPSASAN